MVFAGIRWATSRENDATPRAERSAADNGRVRGSASRPGPPDHPSADGAPAGRVRAPRAAALLVLLAAAALGLFGGPGSAPPADAAMPSARASGPSAPASAAPPSARATGRPDRAAGPATCRIGAYITDLYGLDLTERTINADVWFWSICSRPDLDPTRRFEMINATSFRENDRMTTRRGRDYWTLVKFYGTFRVPISMRDYPFDRHTVKIIVEETRDTSQFFYTPDTVNSTYNPGIRLPDYKISSFRLQVSDYVYRTNFGDPALAPGAASRYSRLIIEIGIERADVTGFIKDTWPAYVGFLIALTSFLLWSSEPGALLGSRLGLLGSALFAIVVNLRAATQPLGALTGVTLVDQIHLYTLMYVLAGFAFTIYTWRLATRPGRWSSARRTNYLVAAVVTLLYLLVNAVAIGLALS